MPIDSKIRELITENGYITIDLMMREALSSNSNSYYKTQSTIGESGDFTTAPEISQVFGEIIALWCIEQWQKRGSPNHFYLLELGPGRGLLMRDLLRTAKLAPQFFKALEVHLLEINPNFIEWQKKNLSSFNKKITWVDTLNFDSFDAPVIIIANEFFDALPIKQYTKVKDTWMEIILTLDPATNRPRLDKISVTKELQEYLQKQHPRAGDGAVLEESPDSISVMQTISNYLKTYGGAGLIIDYGYNIHPSNRTAGQYNDTLQAIKNHSYCGIIDSLGEADLSSHVDFQVLINTLSSHGIKEFSVMDQAEFLIKYGILMRYENMIKKLSKEDARLLTRQVQRLIARDQMGSLFKALIFSS